MNHNIVDSRNVSIKAICRFELDGFVISMSTLIHPGVATWPIDNDHDFKDHWSVSDAIEWVQSQPPRDKAADLTGEGESEGD